MKLKLASSHVSNEKTNKTLFKMMSHIKLVFFLIGLSQGDAIASTCKAENKFVNERITIGNVIVPGSLPIGGVIKKLDVNKEFNVWASCNSAFSFGGVLNYSNTLATPNKVYKTNLEGIGIKIRSAFFDFPDHITMGNDIYGGTIGHRDLYIELIKTGPVTPGILKNGKLVSFYAEGSNGRRVYPVIYYLSGVNKIIVPTCTINNNGIVNVNLGQVKKGDFKSAGSTTGRKKFSINLSCEKGALVQIKFLPPTEGSPDENSGIINVKEQINGAKGVGIQILYDMRNTASPVIFNNKETIERKYSSNGEFRIPMVAQYIKLKDNVKPGKIDAYANFTITYQ